MSDKNKSEGKLKELSKAATELPQSGIRRFFDIASQMANVISLGVGEPDFATPWTVREAAIYSIEKRSDHLHLESWFDRAASRDLKTDQETLRC